MEPIAFPPILCPLIYLDIFKWCHFLSRELLHSHCVCLSVCVCVKEDIQGRYSLIRPLWSAHVISTAWGLPRATSTINHLPFTIHPSDNHPKPSTVAEVAWDQADARLPPQRCVKWVLVKPLDTSCPWTPLNVVNINRKTTILHKLCSIVVLNILVHCKIVKNCDWREELCTHETWDEISKPI